jgi:hypothetical protein
MEPAAEEKATMAKTNATNHDSEKQIPNQTPTRRTGCLCGVTCHCGDDCRCQAS